MNKLIFGWERLTENHLVLTAQNCLREILIKTFKSILPELFCKNEVLKFFFKRSLVKHLCRSLLKKTLETSMAAALFKKDSVQVFSCEFCGNFKRTYLQNICERIHVHSNWVHSGGIAMPFLHFSFHIFWSLKILYKNGSRYCFVLKTPSHCIRAFITQNGIILLYILNIKPYPW